jgi:hypothetical protein
MFLSYIETPHHQKLLPDDTKPLSLHLTSNEVIGDAGVAALSAAI